MSELLSSLVTALKETFVALKEGVSTASSSRHVLKAVGYWNHDGSPPSGAVPESLRLLPEGFPRPPRLMEALGTRTADDQVLRYLRSGHSRMSFLGFSYCRFGCETIEGTSCVTDGTWVWPEGLAHYVEVHHVPLPDEFLETMRRNRWKVPRSARARAITRHWDSTFWVEWTDRCLKLPPTAKSANKVVEDECPK
jgi:hypothetical protein